MENPEKNKGTASVFSSYLKGKYGWEYEVVLPKKKNEPNFDAKLISPNHSELSLQMKHIVKFDDKFVSSKKSEHKIDRPGKDWKMFKNIPLESVVKTSEEKYSDKAKDLILILHTDQGYLIQSDTSLINKNDYKESPFRGIYIVSPKHELWNAYDGKRIQDEFVFEIKSAFKD